MNEEKYISIWTAAAYGMRYIVQHYIDEGFDINEGDVNGITPLHWAAGKGHLDIVMLLVDNGARIEITDNRGSSPLHGAAAGGHRKVVRYLIGKGLDVNATDSGGWTPMHFAACGDKVAVAMLLVEAGADIDAVQESKGDTPLHKAVNYGCVDFVRFLLRRGANTEVRENLFNLTPVQMARQDRNTVVMRLFDEYERRRH